MTTTSEFFDAVRSGDVAAVDEHLRGDSTLATAKNESGISALLWAYYSGQPHVAERLLASGVELNIFEAAAVGDLGRTRELLAGDPALVDACSADGFSPLGLAAFFGRPEVLKLLLNEGADPNSPSRNAMKVTPLHSAAANREPELSLRMVEMLLQSGADPNVRQHGGWTPLQQAAAHGRSRMVDVLLSHGADPTVKSDDGNTAADKAAEGGYGELAERLRQH
jgi:ankyrin repeat protein